MPDESSQLTPEQPSLLNSQQFAAKIRAKYPGAYDDIADDDLTRRVVAKYPEYRDSVKVPLTQQDAGGEIAKASSLPSLGLSEPAPLKPLVPQAPPPRTPGEGAFADSVIQSGKVLGPFQKPTPQQAQHSMDLLNPQSETPHPFEPTPAALPSETRMPLSGPEQPNINPHEMESLTDEVRENANAYLKNIPAAWAEHGPHAAVEGIKTWAHGEMQPGDSGEDERARGLAQVIQGAGVTALPMVAPAMTAAPIGTAVAIGSGMVLGAAAKKAALAAGASPDEAALVEQIGYWSPGLMTAMGRMALKPGTIEMEAPGAWGKALGILPKASPEPQIDPEAFADAKVAAHQKVNAALEETRTKLYQQIESDPALKGNAEAQAQAKAQADEQLSAYGDQQHAKIEAQRVPSSEPPQYRAVAMVGKTPDEYVAGIKAGDHEFTIRIPRPQPAATPEAEPNLAQLPSGAPGEAASPVTPTLPSAAAPVQATQQGSTVESTATPSSPTPSLLHTSEHVTVAPQKPGNMLTVKDVQPPPTTQPQTNPFKPGFYQRAVGVAATMGGRVGIADLQKQLGIQPNNATRLLEQLKADGYVAGTPNFKGWGGQAATTTAPKKAAVPKFLRPGQSDSSIPGVYGAESEVKTPNSTVPVRYKVVEADSLIPSHNAETFAPNPSYPSGVQERTYHTSTEAQGRVLDQESKFAQDHPFMLGNNPSATDGPPVITPDGIVLGGNSRTMTAQRVYARGGGQEYRDSLKAQAASFGLTPEQVDQFQNPILVREAGKPASLEDARRLGQELNKPLTGALGVSEKAVSAGKSITPETLRSISQMIDNLGSDASLREVMAEHGDSILEMLNKDGVITDRERPQFVDTSTGGLSDEGKKFVERALRGVLVDDPVLMDSVPKSILQKLDSSLADILSVGQRKDAYDIMPVIREALAEHAQIVKRGTNAETYFGHKPMFGEWNPMVEAVGRKLAEKQSDVRAAMRSFAQDAAYDKPDQGMLMMGEAPTPVAAFNHAFGTNLSDAEYEKALKFSAEQYGRERAGRKVAPAAPTGQTGEPVTSVTPVTPSIPEPPPRPHQATVEAPKAEQPKYKFGNTQANIPADSDANAALEAARARISDSDLAGKGKDIGDGGNHVTVRYGIRGNDVAGIREYLRQQAPFDAALGRTDMFPPSEHSDGAAVIVAPIDAPELHRMNAELEKQGDFSEPSFKEYKPHATIAYVKPEVTNRYVGMKVTEGKKFRVDSVAISTRDGAQETVPLEGKPENAAPAPATSKVYALKKGVGAWDKGWRVIDENGNTVTRAAKKDEAEERLAWVRSGKAIEDFPRKPIAPKKAEEAQPEPEAPKPVDHPKFTDFFTKNAERAKQPTLSAYLLHKIAVGEMPKDNIALKKLVEGFDGKPADPGRMKQAQEAMEVALVQQARHVVEQGQDARATFDDLVKLYESQPNLNIRTSTSIENQAYSTPAPLAFLADKLAGVGQATTVYEPTAGNGMLLIGANPRKVIANELDPARVEGLKEQGFKPTRGDALETDVTPKSVDAVVTNPPFGSVKDENGVATKVRVDGYKVGQIDHLIAARALDVMKDDGKASLILGANRYTPGEQSEDDRIFFNWLYSHYNVTGHFELDGKLYGRQGAAWPVRVISIGGRKASSAIAPPEGSIPRVKTWSDVYDQFDKSMASQPPDSGVGGSDGSLFGEPADESQPVRVDSGRPAPRVDRQGSQAGEAISHGRPGGNAGPVRDRDGRQPEGLANADSSVRPDADVARSDKLARGENAAPQPERVAEPGRNPQQSSAVTPTENVLQVPYKPASAKKDVNVLIPVNMRQPLEQAMLALEDAVGDLDEFVRKELGYGSLDEVHDHFMGLQVDSVAAAIHQIKNGKAVVIADQTGIGKGRQAAAVIRWAVKQGRVPVFMTKDANLFTDMYGDLADIGTHDINPFIVNSDKSVKLPDGREVFTNSPSRHRKTLESIRDTQKLPYGRNAVFCTYSQINVPNTQQEMLQRLAPKSIFVLDESHNAGGDSNTGEFLRNVLNEAAGVTYLSATYAKRPDNMPLYFKTDMGEAISDDGSLVSAMIQGGLPLQTVVSNNLVKAGQMFRRERSFDGISMVTKVDTAHRAQHVKLADATTEALRAIVDADRAFHETFVASAQEEARKENKANKVSGAGNQANKTVSHAEFSSVVHNFVRQMLLGIKADSAAQDAIAAIERGEKPLVALDNTMGSFLKAYAEEHGLRHGAALEDFDWRSVLSRALDRSRYIKIKDAQGNETKQYVPIDELDDTTRKFYQTAQKLIDKLKIDTPVSPIDWIRHRLEEAGYTVAELTGRELAVDYSEPANPKLAQVPVQEKRDRVETIRKFNDGRLHSLILNVSGSTGISAHASEKFADQRPRHMIVAQPAQDINVFMQMLGRINRTGQVRLPIYTILNADLPAEKRPTALLAKKMKSLNANTSSNTDSATSVKTVDMLNKYGDQIVANYLTDNPDLAGRLGIDDDELGHGGAPAEGLARKATGRLAILPVKVQEEFYNDVEHQYQAYIDYLDATNQNELEPKTFDYDAQELRSDVLAEATNPNSPFGEAAIYGEYSIKAQKPLTADEVTKGIDTNLGGKTPTDHAKALAQDLDEQYAAYRAGMAPDNPMLAHSSVVADTGRRFIYNHKIGDTYRVEINGDTYSAAIVNVRSTHKGAGNPYALSKVNIVLATRGPLRNVSVPATQFNGIEVSALYEKPEGIFRHSAAEVRDTAKIVTGNLLSAYGELKETRGTIINFTKHDGTTEQGILLPKKFDFKQHTRGDYRLRTPDHALKFLRKSVNPRIEDMGIASRDGNVKVVNHHGKLQVITPKAKARGGKYFLDHSITDLTGDFVSQGPTMRADLPKGKEAQVLDQIMRKTALYAAPSMADEAKGMAPKEAVKADKPKASVKMMVTKDDEARLRAMGYPQTDIDKMSPQDAANALGEDGDDGGDSGDTDASSGTVLRSSVFGLDIAAEKVYHLAKRVDGAYQRFIDKVLQGGRLGRAFPEVEAIDPEVGRDLRVLAAAPQYIRARAEHIVDKCTQGMTREQEGGFVRLADKKMHDWLAEERPERYQQYVDDPRIQQALRDLQPYEEELTEARQALGGTVTEGPHMRWVYEKYVAGINKPKAPGEKQVRVPYDRIVTPQMSDRYGRTTTPEYYDEHGHHEFGPSFVTRYVSTMLKLAEHKAAMDFLTKATKVGPGDMLPDSMEYEGQTFFRSDVAQLVRRSVADSPEGKEIAQSLGVDQLPKPSDIREYEIYDPNPPRSGEAVSKELANQVLDAVKTGVTDLDALAGLAYTVKTSHSMGLYLGPKAIVEEFQRGAQHAIPDWLKAVGSVLNPITGMIRRQVIGLGSGVPHIKNILRRIILHSPGAHLNPKGYANACKALFSRELKREAIAGIDTPAFDELLKHAGISDHGIEAYKTYLRSNLDAQAWTRAWNLLKATGADWKEFEKNLLAEIKAAERQGGFLGHAREVTTAVGGAIETPFRPLNFIGHHLIFGPGGFDQRARLLLYKLIKAECPGITPDQMAHQINMELGRYNKASWTTLQQDLQASGLTFFPGWDYSSVEYVLRHPLKGRLPWALLALLANQVIHHYRKNKQKDSTDLSRIHYGKYTISDNLFRERLAESQMGMPLRAASSLLQGHGAEQALRDAVLGVPSDARAFVGMVNPLALSLVEVPTGKELHSGRDIVPAGDRKHKWGPEKDWAGYGIRKFLPVYSELAAPEQKETLGTFGARNLGTNIYEQGKPKGSSARPLFLSGRK